MRRVAAAPLLAFALLLAASTARAEPVHDVWQNGDPANRVDIAILGDGYTAADLAKYAADVDALLTRFFAEEPFHTYRRYFNVHRIDVVSAESGSDHPASNVYRNTALGSSFDCAGITRLICVDMVAVNDVLVRSVTADQHDLTIVLVNDPEYGGSGGQVATGSIHADVVEIMLHETGHTLGLLADEYDYDSQLCDTGAEPFAANVTMQSDRAQIKWNAWIAAQTPLPTTSVAPALPGLYLGAQYCPQAKYRPTYDSRMRSLYRPFEQINTEALTKHVYDFVSPIDDVVRKTTTTAAGADESFAVRMPAPVDHALNVRWTIDGTVAARTPSLTIKAGTLSPGSHHIVLRVSDPTPFVKNDPDGVLRESRAFDVVGPHTSTEAVPALADAYVRGGVWDRTNFGRTSTLLSKLGASADNSRESYVRFDISRVGAGDRVKLRIYGIRSTATSSSMRVGVHAISNTSWDEGTVTWSNKPVAGSLLGVVSLRGTAPSWVELDVTNFIQAERVAGRRTACVALTNSQRTSDYAKFNSRNATGNRPELVITHP